MGATESTEPGVQLPFQNADPNSVTISGYSAGCNMADRMMKIHSASIQGMACYAGWPYGATLEENLNILATSSSITTLATNDLNANLGIIDSTSNLSSRAIYIWGGYWDVLVPYRGAEAMRNVY